MDSNLSTSKGLTTRSVGVLVDGFDTWGGGLDFIRLILNGLVIDPDTRVCLMIPRATMKAELRMLGGGIRQSLLALLQGRFRWMYRGRLKPSKLADGFSDFGNLITFHFYRNTRSGLIRALEKSEVGVVMPSISVLGRDFPLPWVGYVFDFQHRALPQLFDEHESIRRNALFTDMLDNAEVVLVNSEAVRSDAEHYYPGTARKIVCMPFAPSPRPEWLDLIPAHAQERYATGSRYFMVSNQFWVHKDHVTAIRAFAVFSATGASDARLVCTGSPHDFRAPGHADNIRGLMAELGLVDKVMLLGHIPKIDQIGLLRGAISLIQPTLYEGGPGGGAVYDAIAVGVPVLVSDIPVNREIRGGDCRFFPPGDPQALAELMREIASTQMPRLGRDELLTHAQAGLRRLNEALRTAMERATPACRHGC